MMRKKTAAEVEVTTTSSSASHANKSQASSQQDHEDDDDTDTARRHVDDYWPRLGTKNDIPPWLRDNDFILTHHPMPTHSYARSLRLWRCLHMETLNIWTHLVGGLVFILLSLLLLTPYVSASSPDASAAVLALYTLSATTCFLLSATFHILRSHSPPVHTLAGKLDILGIAVLAVGAGASLTRYALFCSPPSLRAAYWSLQAAAGLGAGLALLDTGGGGSRMRALRGGTFAVLAGVAVAPVGHAVAAHEMEVVARESGAAWFAAEVAVLGLGVGVFVARVPERWAPGWFDVWGHSHQVFHLAAVLGAGLHLRGLWEAWRYRLDNRQC